jgi:hypothetical protein
LSTAAPLPTKCGLLLRIAANPDSLPHLMKLYWFAGCILVGLAVVGCQSLTSSDRWMGDKHYRWLAPQTGSNVGRWVEVTDGSGKPKSKTAKKAARPKRQAADLTPAPPADRFR